MVDTRIEPAPATVSAVPVEPVTPAVAPAVAPAITPTPDSPAPEPTKAPEADIVSRVALYKPTEPAATEPVQFNINDFDKIETVEQAKAFAMQSHKSFERGYQKHSQEVAELKKGLEGKVVDTPWTTERVQTLLKDQEFVDAAQGMLKESDGSDGDYSALSEKEKATMTALQKQNATLLQNQNLILQRQQDETLKTKYPNYDSKAVDLIANDLVSGKITNTREYIHRATDYEGAVNRAYQLGRQDERAGITESIQGASFVASAPNVVSSTPAKREKGESDTAFFRRIYAQSLRDQQKGVT